MLSRLLRRRPMASTEIVSPLPPPALLPPLSSPPLEQRRRKKQNVRAAEKARYISPSPPSDRERHTHENGGRNYTKRRARVKKGEKEYISTEKRFKKRKKRVFLRRGLQTNRT